MSLTRVRIENYKSIKYCNIDIKELNLLIGANGTGKTNILDAINYFYNNLTQGQPNDDVFDSNNRYSNQVNITLTFDLSEFEKISKSNAENEKSEDMANIDEDFSGKEIYIKYYKDIVKLANATKNKTVSLNLSQIKGKGILWNLPYEKRFILKSLFPFFYINTRELDITEWSKIWDTLGELGKVSNFERKKLEKRIDDVIDESNIKNKISGIKSVFENSDVSIRKAASKDYAKNLIKLKFSGDEIYQKEKRLNYYSSGTNSVKYIELFLRTTNEIARAKMKHPIILFDEPEISLHSSYIDELCDVIQNVNDKLRMIISTHSPRLTKNLIRDCGSVALFKVGYDGKYTQINRMKKFTQYSPTSKYRVTDEHMNSYFSEAILFVEGETELELFSNPYLRLLYPDLKCVDVYQALSQNPILNIMHPHKTKTKTPYLCMIDMDKAINYENATYKLVLKSEYFTQEAKEKYSYRNKKETKTYLYHMRRRIEAMEKKLHVHYYEPFYSCEDEDYKCFINAIHEYLLNYNVFTMKTTIEGSLINEQTFTFALEYLKNKNKGKTYEDLEEFILSHQNRDRINLLRIVFDGKTDLLKTRKYVLKQLNANDRNTIEKIRFGKKGSGWVSEYLDEFFMAFLPDDCEKSFKGFKKYIEDSVDNKKYAKLVFSQNFAELHELIIKLCNIIR